MSLFSELQNEVKIRLRSPIFGPIIFGFIVANFDPIFIFVYKLVTSYYFVPEHHLQILHSCIKENYIKTFLFSMGFVALRISIPKGYSIVDEYAKSFTMNRLREARKFDLKSENAHLKKIIDRIKTGYEGLNNLILQGDSYFVTALKASNSKWHHGFIESTVSPGDAVSFDENKNLYIKAVKRKPEGIFLERTIGEFGIILEAGTIKLQALESNIEKREANYNINYDDGNWEEAKSINITGGPESILVTTPDHKIIVDKDNLTVKFEPQGPPISIFSYMGVRNFS